MKTVFVFACLLLTTLLQAQSSGYYFNIHGDFNGDDEDEMISEKYTTLQDKKVEKVYNQDKVTVKDYRKLSFSSRAEGIPSFTASKAAMHNGFALLQNVGDLDNDGGEEVAYVIDWLDHSNLNTLFQFLLKRIFLTK